MLEGDLTLAIQAVERRVDLLQDLLHNPGNVQRCGCCRRGGGGRGGGGRGGGGGGRRGGSCRRGWRRSTRRMADVPSAPPPRLRRPRRPRRPPFRAAQRLFAPPLGRPLRRHGQEHHQQRQHQACGELHAGRRAGSVLVNRRGGRGRVFKAAVQEAVARINSLCADAKGDVYCFMPGPVDFFFFYGTHAQAFNVNSQTLGGGGGEKGNKCDCCCSIRSERHFSFIF